MKYQKFNKRGQTAGLEGLTTFITMLVVAGIILTIGIYVEAQIGDTVKDSTTYSNDEITLVNGTAVALTNDEITSLTSNYNTSNVAQTMTVDTDFTVQLIAGTITLINADYVEDWNFTYVYLADTDASAASDSTVTALGDIADWFAIIVVVVIAVIIIGLVVTAFQRRR